MITLSELTIKPLSLHNWQDFLSLFGEKGACGNCWCMSFRFSKKEFIAGKENLGNQKAMYQLVQTNQPTGLLAYFNKQPIAWCAFAPREDFAKLQRSRVHQPIDHQHVWSIPCTFIHKSYRRMGVSVNLLIKVVEYAKLHGIKVLEAYPVIPTQEKLPDAFAWIGLYKSFESAGFEIVDHRSKNRPMVRYYID